MTVRRNKLVRDHRQLVLQHGDDNVVVTRKLSLYDVMFPRVCENFMAKRAVCLDKLSVRCVLLRTNTEQTTTLTSFMHSTTDSSLSGLDLMSWAASLVVVTTTQRVMRRTLKQDP